MGLTILSFSTTATYDFLAIEDASKDKVMDVLFVLKNTEGSKNSSCADAGIKWSLVRNRSWIAVYVVALNYVCFV